MHYYSGRVGSTGYTVGFILESALNPRISPIMVNPKYSQWPFEGTLNVKHSGLVST